MIPIVDGSTRSSSSPPQLRHVAVTAMCIFAWYATSLGLSIYNKWLFGRDHMNFAFPLFTSTLHMVIQFLLAALCVTAFWPAMRPTHIPKLRDYLLKVVPCGIATGLDIGLSNSSLKIISLSFYTMIKSGAPVFVLMFAFLFKLEKPTWKLTGVILLICTGVALMVGGETKFDLRGYVEVQAATVLSGFRWSLTQILLAKASLGMSNPLATSIFLAPVMAVSLIIASAIMEDVRSLPSSALVVSAPGTLAAMLLFGGVLAFLMVMSEFQLIRVTNVVTFSVAGVFKEILTIVASSLVFDDGEWTVVKLCGLLLSLVGIALYNYFRITALQHAGPGHKENAAGASARHSYSAADDHALLVDGSSGVWTEDGDLMDSDDEAVAAIYGVGSLHGYSAVILGSGRKKPNVSAVELELQTVDPLFDSDEHDETMRS